MIHRTSLLRTFYWRRNIYYSATESKHLNAIYRKITVSAISQAEVSFTIVLFQVLYSSRQLRYRLQVTADGSKENEEVNRMTENESDRK